jgi:predicted dehydrogenase
VSAGHKNQMQWEINGTAASLGWQGENPNELWFGRRDGPNEIIAKDPSLMQADVRGVASYPGGHAEGYPDTFKQLFKAVYRYIAQGDYTAPAPFPTFDDGRTEIVLCDAIQRSARERRWVSVD